MLLDMQTSQILAPISVQAQRNGGRDQRPASESSMVWGTDRTCLAYAVPVQCWHSKKMICCILFQEIKNKTRTMPSFCLFSTGVPKTNPSLLHD